MLSHIRQVNSDDNDFQIICGISNCEKSYNKYDSFSRHVKNRHHVDISTALRLPSEEIYLEGCQVINLCQVYRSL